MTRPARLPWPRADPTRWSTSCGATGTVGSSRCWTTLRMRATTRGKQATRGSLQVTVDRARRGSPADRYAESDGPALLLLNILTSEVRNCVRASARLQALGPLQSLCPYLADEDVLDRLLPYVIYLANDEMPQVRAESCRALAAIVSRLHRFPPADLELKHLHIASFAPSRPCLLQTRT